MYSLHIKGFTRPPFITEDVKNAFEDPREIGYFSVNKEREILYDDCSMMRHYVPSKNKQNMDLNDGYEDKSWDLLDSSNKIDQLLKWIAYKKFEPLHVEPAENASSLIVCPRDIIKTLLCTPHSRDKWFLCACRLDNVIYLRSIPTDEKPNAAERKMIAWDYKFEQYMTKHQNGRPDPSSPNYGQEKFYIAATNKIGEYKLLITAEVDGVNSSAYKKRKNGDTSCYVEMETARMVPNYQDSLTFKKSKSLQLWAQSIILGIKENICGLRDNKGIIQSIENFPTDRLPEFAQYYSEGDKPHQRFKTEYWSPQTCFNFCYYFLAHVKNILVENNPRIVYHLKYNGGNEKYIHFSKPNLENRLNSKSQVLPGWFLSEEKEHKKSQ